MAWMCHGPGVHVVAFVPVAGPVPPPIIVVTPDISASSICCGQMKWMCASMPHAVADHFSAPELHLLAVDREVALDLDQQVRIGEPHAVADGRPELLGIAA